jgi:hypothetical protein
MGAFFNTHQEDRNVTFTARASGEFYAEGTEAQHAGSDGAISGQSGEVGQVAGEAGGGDTFT